MLLSTATEMIASIRKVLTLKTNMNGNRKIIAGLELLESTSAGLLQQILDTLQSKIPLATLLTSVLNQNSGNTVRDINGIVTKVIHSLQMDIEGFDNFVRIYKRDYNDCLHQKADLIKQPLLFKYSTCFGCKEGIGKNDQCRCFTCGHIYHTSCCEDHCLYCEKVKTMTIRNVL